MTFTIDLITHQNLNSLLDKKNGYEHSKEFSCNSGKPRNDVACI